ncbi:two-component system response regulator [Bacillus cereus]|uniref:Two-component system response regulator n=2 Tax=Bacillus cereus TaxID=1396 RepID=A0A9X6SSS3_BACCE|nr:two-component system response regulator [Bacillus cereus]
MWAVLKDLLEKNGYEIIGMAKNGEMGVQMYEQLYISGDKPDLVLMDITMKKKNGIEALKEIKQIDAMSKVVMVSSVGAKDSLVEAIQAGAKYFIKKPFEDDELLITVKKAIASN